MLRQAFRHLVRPYAISSTRKGQSVKCNRRAAVVDNSEAGFSLMEVIVAIAVISIVAISSVTLTINGIKIAAAQERRQIAVTIASGAMETVSAQSVSNLYEGRAKSDVQRDFATNSSVPGIARLASGDYPTYQVWDQHPTPPVTIPATALPVIRSGTNFTVTTLIGPCYQPTTIQAGPAGDCKTLTRHNDPSDQVAGYLSLVRVVVVVKWTSGSGCSVGGCLYSATTLIDPNQDLEWVTHD